MSFNNKDSTAFFWHLMLIVFNLVNFSWTGCLRPLTMHTVHFYKTNQRCFSSRPAEEVRWMRLCSTAIKKNYTVNMFWGLHCPQFWETTWVKSLRAVQHYEILVPIFPFTWPDVVCCHCHPLRESQWVAVSESPIYSTVPAVDCTKISVLCQFSSSL